MDIDKVRHVFPELLRNFPQDCASLSISEDRTPEKLSLKITPREKQAAEIRAVIEPNLVTLFFGRGGVFEVPEKGRYTQFTAPEEIRVLCSAVMNGKYEETITISKGELLGARASISIPDEVVKEQWRKVSLGLLRKKEKQHFTYSSYCSDTR